MTMVAVALVVLVATIVGASSSSSFVLVARTTTTTTTTVRRRRPHMLVRASSSSFDDDVVAVVRPDARFRDTVDGEVSVVSYNALAPSYRALSVDGPEERAAFARRDRASRFAASLRAAKARNADVLCLQEVEGGPHLSLLRDSLAEDVVLADDDDDGPVVRGYDACEWRPLRPGRPEDVVGLCVAWRSDRHERASRTRGFPRGMACALREISTGDAFVVVNVHLPGRPSDVAGRLGGASRAAREAALAFAEAEETSSSYEDEDGSSSPLRGLSVVAGDFNGDVRSAAARLLAEGRVPRGLVRDRNHKLRLSRDAAAATRHDLRYRDAYEGHEDVSPVTVSLAGRAPGRTDLLLLARFEPSSSSSSRRRRRGRTNDDQRWTDRGASKRARRRRRGTTVATSSSSSSPGARAEAVLATATEDDEEGRRRRRLIDAGLPNVDEGFFSDHLPIGALFAPEKKEEEAKKKDDDAPAAVVVPVARGGATARVVARRAARAASVARRRRHDAVLARVAARLIDGGATDLVRDRPLYRSGWAVGAEGLTRRSRAPDLVCRVGDALVVLEATVVDRRDAVDAVRRAKRRAYADLPDALSTAPAARAAGLTVPPLFVVSLSANDDDDDDGVAVHEGTERDVRRLVELMSPADENEDDEDAERRLARETRAFCDDLKRALENDDADDRRRSTRAS